MRLSIRKMGKKGQRFGLNCRFCPKIGTNSAVVSFSCRPAAFRRTEQRHVRFGGDKALFNEQRRAAGILHHRKGVAAGELLKHPELCGAAHSGNGYPASRVCAVFHHKHHRLSGCVMQIIVYQLLNCSRTRRFLPCFHGALLAKSPAASYAKAKHYVKLHKRKAVYL